MVAAHRIHLTGGSGSGTSTLGQALAEALGVPHHDTDDFFWLPTDPPYQEPRPREARCALLAHRLDRRPGWVLSGSLSGWGDVFIDRFTLVVFMDLDKRARIARLKQRERRRYGDAIDPGGAMHDAHVRFMAWAGAYDTGGPEMRSRKMHEAWLAYMHCPVLRMDGRLPTERQVAIVLDQLAEPREARA